MSLTSIIQSAGVKIHVQKKKVSQGSKEPISAKESVLDYLTTQIELLKSRGNLNPQYHTIKKGDRKGEKIREITAWSAVDSDGKREMVIMCRNKKVYINEEAAKQDKGIFLDDADNNYDGVLTFLESVKSAIEKEDTFSAWTRIKKGGRIEQIA